MRRFTFVALIVLAVGESWSPVPLGAQQPILAPGFPGPSEASLEDVAPEADKGPGSPDLTAWQPPSPNLPRALVGVSAVNVLAIGINILWRDEPATNPGSWWDNINGGWEWDPNPIRVNSFEHPWAGAAYYNVSRANGLSVYASMPLTLAGSLMWELVGEPRPPSTNDLVTTTLGGVVLGEPLRLMSLELLDNQAAGLNRFLREATVFVFNPGLGLDRLTRGQSWASGANPPARGTVPIRTGALFGATRLTPGDDNPGEEADAGILRLDIEFGDPFATEDYATFSSFAGTVEFSSLSAVLTRLSVRGLLTPIGRRAVASDNVTGVFLDFDYRWDGRVGFALQSAGLGLLSRFGGDAWKLRTDLSGELVPLLASTDRWSREAIGRYYEFGTGLGVRAGAGLEHRQSMLLSASLRAYWTATLNGASSSKLVQLAEFEARSPALGPLSLGAALRLYRQNSRYDDRPSGSESMSSVSIFLSMVN
jgi:hypothetical protein